MKKLLNVFLILNLAFSFVIASFSTAKAASLTELSDTMSSLTGGYSNHTIKFKTPSGINANTDTIIITFAHGSADGTNYTDIDLSHGVSTGYEGDENLGSSAGANQWGASVNSGPLTITLTAPTDAGASEIVGGEYIVVEVGLNATTGTAGNAQLNGVGGPGDTDIMTIAGTFGDTGQIAYVTLANDQVGVTATVDPTLSFSISDLAIGFGSFNGTAIRYATSNAAGSATDPVAPGDPTLFTVSTNGDNGATITIQDEGSGSNPGLWSAAPISELIPAAASSLVTIGSKTFGAFGKNASSLTIAEAFDNDTNSDVAISRTAQVFATASGPVSNAMVELSLKAAIDGTTKAGNYTDTITVTCTGNF